MNDTSSIPFAVIPITAAIVMLVLMPKFDRKRIRENIETHGGKVIEGVRLWNWGRNDRRYEVTYAAANGRQMKATCRTNMWLGVDWVDPRPPGAAC